jgi:DNA-directed RNA polymerase subunit RPC12/RpoP
MPEYNVFVGEVVSLSEGTFFPIQENFALASRYTYVCGKCGGPVTKEPVSKTHGLHGWRCGMCGPGVKVTRASIREKSEKPNV